MQIYIHIPFCEQKCGYCRFASTGKIMNLHIERYVNFLCEEIKKQESATISTIYFGGGTPGVLNLIQFERILNTIKNQYILSKNIEISIETTPDKINEENLIGWKKLGINRISIGVQTFNEKSLKEIGRGKKGEILKALDIISDIEGKLGYNINLSVDFIIGLPYVKKGEILENIKYTLDNFNFIKHISVYMLEDYYSPDKIIETKYDNITYPEDWEKQGIREKEFLGEYSSIKKYLINLGFNNYEISNYGKPGFECKHNIGYWNHSEVLGFGLGAYGFINNFRYANSDSFKDYYAGKINFKNKLTEDDIFLEKVMFQLRTGGLKEENYKKLNTKKINYFIKNNYMFFSLSSEGFKPLLKLSDSGILVMDYIISEII